MLSLRARPIPTTKDTPAASAAFLLLVGLRGPGRLSGARPMPTARDLAGEQFHFLTVIQRIGTKNASPLWQCRCTCGQLVSATSGSLMHGQRKSCGCKSGLLRAGRHNRKFVDLTGMRFGRLLVTGYASRQQWNVVCECGTAKTVHGNAMRRGVTLSCGCLHREIATAVNTTHGHASRGTRGHEYSIWRAMLNRCTCEGDTAYQRYGACGITVCDRWRHSFENFYADMGPRPSPKHSIDRIDNSGNYEPDNCRWATLQQQARNRRSNVMLTFRNETRCAEEWAAIVGIPGKLICARKRSGWSDEDALTRPVRATRLTHA